jgi:P27 family predicted phage terminase small subunit
MVGLKRGPKPKDRSLSTPLKGKPAAPKHLDKVAKDQWKKVADLVEQAGLLSRLDVFALEQYVSLYATWREASEMVKKLGLVTKAPNGWQLKNPWYDIVVQSLKDMKYYLDKFGLTPAARAKLALAEPDEVDDKWADLD